MAVNQQKQNADGSTGAGRSGLARLLDGGAGYSKEQLQELDEVLGSGFRFYNEYNDSRLELALSSFDGPMKLALFELLFLLHVNTPDLAAWKYRATRYEMVDGVRKHVSTDETANLYLEGAPSGIRGMNSLSPLIKSAYESYIQGEFGMNPFGRGQVGLAPIVALQSVGSIGTVGHKSKDSDLDLQVVYDLTPFGFDTSNWDSGVLKNALNREHKWWSNFLRKKQKLGVEDLKKPEIKKELSSKAARILNKSYPGLYKYLVNEDQDFANELFASGKDALRQEVLQEMITLVKRVDKLSRAGEMRRQEALLKERLDRIQTYINDKFPSAEIYLFVYSVEGFRQGRYSSSLEFKESSGSAYEMILNYETLMPGIQFTPMVPAHFIVPESHNNDSAAYGRLIDHIRFQAVGAYQKYQNTILDLGNVPQLDGTYVAEHGGAIYWEAFKASSGNLAKALLNLLRFEMLLDEKFLKTIIQIIKQPDCIDQYAAPKPEDPTQQMAAVGLMKTGLPAWSIMEMEEQFPKLLQDPWWLRYKALKIAFCEENGATGLESDERDRISLVIDIAFCLHLRISDVLTLSEKDQKNASHRDQVMLELYNRAFPPDSARRINLQNLFSGGVRGLIFFENEMRDLFKRSITRVEQKMAQLNVRDHAGESKEVELWLNYYLENFQPPAGVVPQVIMKHLKVPRPGIAVSYRPDDGWVFMSVQHRNILGVAAGESKAVSYLPDKVVLIEKTGFLSGLAHCIINGYYGPIGKGTDNETHTAFEIDLTKIDLGTNIHNDLTRLDSEHINDLANRIIRFFPYEYVNYLDIVNVERKVRGVFICLNLFGFGHLAVLYRDNINTWFCEDFDLKEVFGKAQALSANMGKLLQAKPIHDTLGEFFQRKKIDLNEVQLGAWANPNSLAADRTLAHHSRAKDMESGATFLELICKAQGVQPPVPQAFGGAKS